MSQSFQIHYSSNQPRSIVIKPLDKPLDKSNKIALVLEAVEEGAKVAARFQPTASLYTDASAKLTAKQIYGVIGLVQIDKGMCL